MRKITAFILAAALLVALPLARPAAARSALYDVSQSFYRHFNNGDAASIHAMLSAPLRERYTVAGVAEVIARCHGIYGPIDRISLPTSGGRHFAFFAVYVKDGIVEMILEVDPEEKIVFWILSPDAMAGDTTCSLNDFTAD